MSLLTLNTVGFAFAITLSLVFFITSVVSCIFGLITKKLKHKTNSMISFWVAMIMAFFTFVFNSNIDYMEGKEQTFSFIQTPEK